MDKKSFPGIHYHKDQHRVFVSSLEQLKEKHEAWEVSPALLELLQAQLCGWIVTHVMKSDKKFVDFVARGTGSA